MCFDALTKTKIFLAQRAELATEVYRSMPKVTGKRCVNCGLAVAIAATVAGALPPRALAALHQWIPPSLQYTQEQLQNEPICHDCFILLETFEAIEAGDASGETGPEAGPEAGPGAGPPKRVLGHAKVCRLCGRSVYKIRSVMLLEKRPDNPKIARIFDEVTAQAPKLFEHLKEVCRTCLRRVERALEKGDAAGTAAAADSDTEETAVKPEQTDFTRQQIVKKPIKSERLALSEYRRVYVSKGACAVKGCSRAAEAAPLTTRRLLMRHRLYLPGHARLCDAHHSPDKAFEHNYNTGTFTGEQLADMLFLMKPAPPALDADNITSMDPHLRRMWLGVTLDQFENLCESHQIPPRALALRLCATASGECAEVLASMFQLSRKDVNEALRLTEHVSLKVKDDVATLNDKGNTEKATADAQYKLCMKNLVEKEAPTTPEDMDVDTLLDQIMSE